MAGTTGFYRFRGARISRGQHDVPAPGRPGLRLEGTPLRVSYIPRTRELYADFNNPYRWVTNESVPWPPLTKPIAQCKVALISSGGIMYRDQPRFHREDASYRRIPRGAAREDLNIWHFG